MPTHRRRLSSLLAAALALVALPGRAFATDLTSASSLLFDIQDGLGFGGSDGSLSNGSIDAYDGCYYLQVDGTQYVASEPATLSLGGRQVDMPEVTIGSLVARRFIYVPETGGSWARYLDVISNPTSAPVTASIAITGNLGSDSSTVVVTSSSGDATVGTDDLWFATDDTDGGGDPSLAHLVQGTSPATGVTELSLSFDNLRYAWSVTIPAGGRVAFLTFALQDDSQAIVQSEARRLVELPDDALVGIDAYLADIVNFQAGTPCAGAEGAACSARGRTGTCHATRCCIGCWDGTRCLTGTTGSACGLSGGACRSCADGDLCTSDVCTVGACSNPLAPRGTACDDRAFCTTGDVCDGAGGCVGSGPPPCDDARACTLDTCDEATDRCGHAMGAGCVIGGECVAADTRHPAYPCLVCDPTRSTTDWSPAFVGMACGDALCVGGRLRMAPTCDASGACSAPPAMACATGSCADTSSCVRPCAETGCATGSYCAMDGACRTLVAVGRACTTDAMCGTGQCVDGVCCESACDGVCAACDIAGAQGTCTPRPRGSDPDMECAGLGCDGAGACAVRPDAGTPAPDAGPADAGAVDASTGAPDAGAGGFDAGTGPTPTRSSGCAVAAGGAEGPVWGLGLGLAALAILGRRRRR